MSLRKQARAIFNGTLERLRIDETMAGAVSAEGSLLRVGEWVYELKEFSSLVVVAMGKAAFPMVNALVMRVLPALRRGQELRGIAVGVGETCGELRVADARIRWLRGDHPLPGLGSELAAEAILELLAGCDERCLVFFLLSGGASAMVEEGLDAEISIKDCAAVHRALVHSGLPIAKMNTLRKHLSRVKGGRLALAAGQASQCTLLISDVAWGIEDAVGSGPSLPDRSTLADCRAILTANAATRFLPKKILSRFFDGSLPETPKPDDAAFTKSRWITLLSSEDMAAAAGDLARAEGFHVEVDNRCDDWDYADASQYLLRRLQDVAREHTRVCLISVGEVTVRLPTRHGIGGRNQQFVLECARRLHEGGLRACVLCAGSDGVDGNSPAAGGVCDETTVERAGAMGMEVNGALKRFDTFGLLQALGDAVITGPTGNNLRDLRILLAEG